MKVLFKKVIQWLTVNLKRIAPGSVSIKGAAWGLIIFTGIFYLVNAIIIAFTTKDVWVLLPAIAFVLLAWAGALLVDWLLTLLQKIPRFNKLAVLVCVPLLLFSFMFDPVVVALLVLIASLLGASFLVFRKTGLSNLTTAKKVIWLSGLTIGLAGLGTGAFFYFKRGLAMDPFENAASLNAKDIPHVSGKSPAAQGPFTVKTLTYGSGRDTHRPEFGKQVTLKTNPVDGTAFLDNWSGLAGNFRTFYWGFNAKALPVNARVWYPEGQGPFPLVLVVHGNHNMTDFSDPGYDYLGELLASRGMIVASVDENFLNGNWSDITGGLKKENDARGWMLLEHLKVWHQWNKTNGHPFFGRVDTGRIALIGHSRGGEAVAHAALFNALGYYPDDATVKLNYHYNIRGIVSIAPVDGQYQPGETPPAIKDVDYFTLHGSQDGDVTSFMGSMQFERVTFTDTNYHFKAGLYIYGANHGQFNTSWGDNDFSLSFKGLFNLAQLMPAKEQQEIAKVFISAFLETSLLGKKNYLPLFADARQARRWLPETVYLNQFEDANTIYAAGYDEDFDVLTGSMDAVIISGDHLSVWREQEIRLKEAKKGSRGVYLGWHYDPQKKDSVKNRKIRDWVPDSVIASYSIHFGQDVSGLDSSMALVFSMAESKEESNPKAEGKWKVEAVGEDEAKVKVKDKAKVEVEDKIEEKKGGAPARPIDFTIELTDKNGEKVSFPLSSFSALQRELEVRIWKMDFLKGKKESEKVFQKFIFPLSHFNRINASFNPGQLRQVSFVFDRLENGVVVIDNLGFMKEPN